MRHVMGCDMTWLVMRHDMWCGLTCHYKNLIAITCACHLLLRCLVQLYLNKVRLTMNIIFIYQKIIIMTSGVYIMQQGEYSTKRLSFWSTVFHWRIFHQDIVFLVSCIISVENIPHHKWNITQKCLSSQQYLAGEYSTKRLVSSVSLENNTKSLSGQLY